MCRSSGTPFELIEAGLRALPGWLARQQNSQLGPAVAKGREVIDKLEAVNAEATRRFEKSGAYRADGAVDMVAWLRTHGKLTGGTAALLVQTARQLGELPRTEEALARGEIGYQHAVAMARAAEHVGAAAVRKAETNLLTAAQTMDPGAFVTVAKQFEHQVDSEAALREANRAHGRRYLSLSEPLSGLVRIEGQLVSETAARLRTAMQPFMKPGKSDDRSAGQRAHDALDQVLSRAGAGHPDGAGPRPQFVIRVDLDTLAGLDGAPAGEIDGAGTIPTETVQRLACDSAITRITGLAEYELEITHAARTIPSATRRTAVARDRHCVFPGCDRPAPWCEVHHLVFWGKGGPTKLDNLALLCKVHHRRVHEEGWTLNRKDSLWQATPPRQNNRVLVSARL